jgi:hypothetical protein
MFAWRNISEKNERGAPAVTPTATASLAATAPATLPFPRPTSYGVYAIHNDQLIELERIEGRPVDPRTRSQLQITKPSRTVIDDPKLTFVLYRREFAWKVPDSVKVRVAARLAHSMIFDSNGKPALTTPEMDTWLIRNDYEYELRVSPVPENAEMIEVRSVESNFAYSPGRYELMVGDQAYDFVVAGKVFDMAHCVEGVATGRGPVFYECKSAR